MLPRSPKVETAFQTLGCKTKSLRDIRSPQLGRPATVFTVVDRDSGGLVIESAARCFEFGSGLAAVFAEEVGEFCMLAPDGPAKWCGGRLIFRIHICTFSNQ